MKTNPRNIIIPSIDSWENFVKQILSNDRCPADTGYGEMRGANWLHSDSFLGRNIRHGSHRDGFCYRFYFTADKIHPVQYSQTPYRWRRPVDRWLLHQTIFIDMFQRYDTTGVDTPLQHSYFIQRSLRTFGGRCWLLFERNSAVV